MNFCKLCNRQVAAKREFSWFWFLALCLTGIGGIFYLFYYPMKPKRCPICRCKV